MRSSTRLVHGLVLLGLAACDRNGRSLVQRPDADFEPVIDLGQLNVIDVDTAKAIGPSICDAADGTKNCAYDQVGTPSAGTRGGATFTFLGTGDEVCIVVDPESVFWNTSISPLSPNAIYEYPDNVRDDGDIDLFAGLSSYYTGSPGINLGDFKGYYTDSLGHTVEIEYSECSQTGLNNLSGAHAGRGSPESCTLDTSQRKGVQYTVVLQTFETPLDDGVLSFGAMVVDGNCTKVSVNECTIPDEALNAESGAEVSGFAALEAAYCQDDMLAYCCAHPDQCGEPPDGLCDNVDTSTDTGG